MTPNRAVAYVLMFSLPLLLAGSYFGYAWPGVVEYGQMQVTATTYAATFHSIFTTTGTSYTSTAIKTTTGSTTSFKTVVLSRTVTSSTTLKATGTSFYTTTQATSSISTTSTATTSSVVVATTTSGTGCFVSTQGGTWQQTQCTSAPNIPLDHTIKPGLGLTDLIGSLNPLFVGQSGGLGWTVSPVAMFGYLVAFVVGLYLRRKD